MWGRKKQKDAHLTHPTPSTTPATDEDIRRFIAQLPKHRRAAALFVWRTHKRLWGDSPPDDSTCGKH